MSGVVQLDRVAAGRPGVDHPRRERPVARVDPARIGSSAGSLGAGRPPAPDHQPGACARSQGRRPHRTSCSRGEPPAASPAAQADPARMSGSRLNPLGQLVPPGGGAGAAYRRLRPQANSKPGCTAGGHQTVEALWRESSTRVVDQGERMPASWRIAILRRWPKVTVGPAPCWRATDKRTDARVAGQGLQRRAGRRRRRAGGPAVRRDGGRRREGLCSVCGVISPLGSTSANTTSAPRAGAVGDGQKVIEGTTTSSATPAPASPVQRHAVGQAAAWRRRPSRERSKASTRGPVVRKSSRSAAATAAMSSSSMVCRP